MTEDFLPQIEQALARRIPGFEYLAHAIRLSTGVSQQTWSLDAIANRVALPLILRYSPRGHTAPGALPLATEAHVIDVARQAGCAVPAVRYVFVPEDEIGEGYLMVRMAGETGASKILRDEAFDDVRPLLIGQCAAALAHIHAVDLAPLAASLPHLDGPALLAHYRALYDSYDIPHPVFELAFKWLQTHLGPAATTALVHGDFRLGNLLVTPNGLNAVLDWKQSHLGDPLEDIGWISTRSWRFGVNRKIVGGLGGLDDFFDAYAKAGGRRITMEELRPWIVLGSLKWGIMCMGMYHDFPNDGSVERATIGRRVSECEYDLVQMILYGAV